MEQNNWKLKQSQMDYKTCVDRQLLLVEDNAALRTQYRKGQIETQNIRAQAKVWKLQVMKALTNAKSKLKGNSNNATTSKAQNGPPPTLRAETTRMNREIKLGCEKVQQTPYVEIDAEDPTLPKAPHVDMADSNLNFVADSSKRIKTKGIQSIAAKGKCEFTVISKWSSMPPRVIVAIGDHRMMCQGCPGDTFLKGLSDHDMLSSTVVFVLDKQAYIFCASHADVKCILYHVEASEMQKGRHLREIVSAAKFLFVRSVLQCGPDVLLLDLDLSIMGNPFKYIPLDADVVGMSDGVDWDDIYGAIAQTPDAKQHSKSFGKYPFPVWESRRSLINSGTFFMKSNERTIAAMLSVDQHCKSANIWDQAAFNHIFLPKGSQYGHGLSLRIANPFIFSNSFFFDTRLKNNPKLTFKPVLVHANYRDGNSKRGYLENITRHLAVRKNPLFAIGKTGDEVLNAEDTLPLPKKPDGWQDTMVFDQAKDLYGTLGRAHLYPHCSEEEYGEGVKLTEEQCVHNLMNSHWNYAVHINGDTCHFCILQRNETQYEFDASARSFLKNNKIASCCLLSLACCPASMRKHPTKGQDKLSAG